MLETHKSRCDLLGNTTSDVTIENQQERLFFNIGYILGALDSDGCYQFGRKYSTKDYVVYEPKITFNNNNINIINQFINCLKELKISYHLWTPKLHGKEKNRCHRVRIAGIKRVKNFTDFILKYPSGKKERAQTLNEYCKLRLSIPFGKRKLYVNQEKVYFDKLKNLNLQFRKGTVSPETTRLAS